MQADGKAHRQEARIGTGIIEGSRQGIQGVVGGCVAIDLAQAPNGFYASGEYQEPSENRTQYLYFTTRPVFHLRR